MFQCPSGSHPDGAQERLPQKTPYVIKKGTCVKSHRETKPIVWAAEFCSWEQSKSAAIRHGVLRLDGTKEAITQKEPCKSLYIRGWQLFDMKWHFFIYKITFLFLRYSLFQPKNGDNTSVNTSECVALPLCFHQQCLGILLKWNKDGGKNTACHCTIFQRAIGVIQEQKAWKWPNQIHWF